MDLRIWIDATEPRSTLRLFGMPLLERVLRALLEARLAGVEVRVDLPASAPDPALRADLPRLLRLRFVRGDAPVAARLAEAFSERPDVPMLALPADAVLDPRALAHLAALHGSLATFGGEGEERTAILRLEKTPPAVSGERLLDVAEALVSGGALAPLPLAAVPDYVRKLRKHLPAYAFAIPDAESRDRAERFLFWSNYKGSTDFFTRYVYPPVVWRLVRPLARWRVHPNWITCFNIAVTFAALPLWAADWWWTGFACAYAMSILDSVDGKLARLTYRASRLGDVLDHGLDLVHPPFWYAAWAWGLDGPASPIFRLSLWLAALYALDRGVIAIFRWRVGKSIHGYTDLDARMRTWISRRNINLPLFLIGFAAGVPREAFLAIVAWQVATLLFHAERLVRFWRPSSRPDGVFAPAPR